MKIFIDECVWQVTRDLVQQLGHDVASVEERGLTGADDDTVLAQAKEPWLLSTTTSFASADKH
jgi:predicted nuclease of predicted toxin-antitoxin system